ncbi:MAG: RNA polymerase sigma factor [Bacteroidetes bacterium]|nr:MAG: RNA polymerase sigma factor [Bacteroidota bacterium]
MHTGKLNELPCDKANIPEQLKQGPKEEDLAIRCLMKLCWSSVQKFVRGYRGNEQDGEDIFMEALTEVVRQVKSGEFRGEAAITTFLISVSKNMWLSRLRKWGREVYPSEEDSEGEKWTPSQVATFVAEPDNADKLEQIAQFLEVSLGQACKEILLLDMEKYRTKEIVELLEGFSNPASIDNKRSQCRKKLKRKLATEKGLRQWLEELIDK